MSEAPPAPRAVPDGFRFSARSSNFLETVGPPYEREQDGDYRIGLFVDERHVNNRGFCHGALMALLADVHLGRLCALSTTPRLNVVTSNLTLAFLSTARLGAWLEAVGQIDRIGKALAHSSGVVTADGTPVLRATGTFAVVAVPAGKAA
jgi:acyl-coenzyme A thioesterase 13